MTVDDATVNTGCIWDGFVGNGSMTITDHGTVNDTGDFVEACTAGNTGSLSLTNGATLNVGGGVIIGGISTTAAAGTATASIGAGSTLDVKGAMHVEAGSTVSLAGGTISSGDSGGYMVVMSGASIKGNGVLTSAAPNGGYENDNGMIEASGGTLRVDGTVFGSGAMQIDAGATLAITSQIINPIGITFAGSGSTLDINHGANIQAQLNGFTFGDQIVTSGVSSATWSASNDVLTLYNGSQVVDMLHVLGSYAGDTFQVSQNGSNSIITLNMLTDTYTGAGQAGNWTDPSNWAGGVPGLLGHGARQWRPEPDRYVLDGRGQPHGHWWRDADLHRHRHLLR
jgi:hypothetical protein